MKSKHLAMVVASALAVTPVYAQEAQQTTEGIESLEHVLQLYSQNNQIELEHTTIDSLDGLSDYNPEQLVQALGENFQVDMIYTDEGISEQTISEVNSALHLLGYPSTTGSNYSNLTNDSLHEFKQAYETTYPQDQITSTIDNYLPLGISRAHDAKLADMFLKAIAEGQMNLTQQQNVELVPRDQAPSNEAQETTQETQYQPQLAQQPSTTTEQSSPEQQQSITDPRDCDETTFESLKPYQDEQAPYDIDAVLSLYQIPVRYINCTEYERLWELLGLSSDYNPTTHAEAVGEYQFVHDQEITYRLTDIVPMLNFENLVHATYETLVEHNTTDKEYLRKLSWLLREDDSLDSFSTENSYHEQDIIEFTNHLDLERLFTLNQDIKDHIDTQLIYNIAIHYGFFETENIRGTNLYEIGDDDFTSLRSLQAFTTLVGQEDLSVTEPSNAKAILSNFYQTKELHQERLEADTHREQHSPNHQTYRVGPDEAY